MSAEALERLARTAGSAGVFCDFDGCLSPIVPDPAEARAVPGAEAALAHLAEAFAVVAVISGRAAADLAARVRAPGVRLLGLHGLEEVTAEGVRVLAEADEARAAVERVAARIEGELSHGALLERKGLALAVHFRRAPDAEAAERALAPVVRDAAAAEGLAVERGRRILEVRPPTDKGEAVRRIVAEAGLSGALVAGDDAGDLAAFRALDGSEVAVRVAVSSDEAPHALLEAADLIVDGPEAFVALLAELTDLTSPGP